MGARACAAAKTAHLHRVLLHCRYGYAFAAAKADVWHKWDTTSMIYPMYEPQGASLDLGVRGFGVRVLGFFGWMGWWVGFHCFGLGLGCTFWR